MSFRRSLPSFPPAGLHHPQQAQQFFNMPPQQPIMGGRDRRDELGDWARQRDERMGGGAGPKAPGAGAAASEWTCFKCFINNFNGRSTCFKCGTPRQSYEELDAKGLSMIGAAPCDTLLVRELPSTATEASVRAAIGRGTDLVALRVRIAASRHFAFVQMRSLQEAMLAHQTMRKTCPYIDNCAVIVTFSSKPLDLVLDEGRIQLLPPESQPKIAESGRDGGRTVNTPFGILPVYPVPDPKKFRYEPNSGYFYDHDTGFYYDSRTEFFYTPKGNKWMFWCNVYRTYINCEGGDLELKRQLQEGAGGEQKKKPQQQSPPESREPDHRDALRHAPPPPLPPRRPSVGVADGDMRDQRERAVMASGDRGGGGGGVDHQRLSGDRERGIEEQRLMASGDRGGGDHQRLLASGDRGMAASGERAQQQQRRPLLLELEDSDNDDDDVVMVEPGAESKKSRKRKKKKQQLLQLQQEIREQQQMRELTPKMPSSTGTSAKNSSAPNESPMIATLRESLRLNRIVIDQLDEQLMTARDARAASGIQKQLDVLVAQQRNLEATIADAGGVVGGEAPGTTPRRHEVAEQQAHPQLKRHITKEQLRPPPIVAERRSPSIVDIDESPPRKHHQHSSSKHRRSRSVSSSPERGGRGDSSWRDDSRRSHHGQGRHDQHGDLSQLVSKMVERSMDEEWRNFRDRQQQEKRERRRATRSRSPSPRRAAVRDEAWRESGGSKGKERRSRQWDDDERHAERDHHHRSSDRDHDRRRHHSSPRNELQPPLPGQEPMAIASSPSPPPVFRGESWLPGVGGGDGRLPPPPAPPNLHAGRPPMETMFGRPMMPSTAERVDPRMMMMGGPPGLHPMGMGMTPNLGGPPMMMGMIPPRGQFGPEDMPVGMIHPADRMMMASGPGFRRPQPPRPLMMEMGGMGTPYVPQPFMPRGSSSSSMDRQFFREPNPNPLMDQQRRFPGALSASAAHQIGVTPPGRGPGGFVNETLVQAQKRALEDMKKKNELASKERDQIRDLNICFNCGRQGHSQFACRFERISDDELSKKIRYLKEKKQRQELDKEQLKKRADKYNVRRKDPLIERLRVAAPSGKIHKESFRLICPKCAYFNHTRAECSRPEVPRSLHREISEALDNFKKVFFIHLQEDNLVDLAQKFDLFRVMDAIEQNGTIDPVGLQLHGLCPDGIVTQMDLREMCSNCAQLGHKRVECKDKQECSRTHYDKMLTLVKGYRALVKEGRGNFLLPRTNMDPGALVLKDIERGGGGAPVEEILLLDSSSESDGEAEKHTNRENSAEKEKQTNKNSDKTPEKQTAKEGSERTPEKQTTKDDADGGQKTAAAENGADKNDEDDDDIIAYDWPLPKEADKPAEPENVGEKRQEEENVQKSTTADEGENAAQQQNAKDDEQQAKEQNQENNNNDQQGDKNDGGDDNVVMV